MLRFHARVFPLACLVLTPLVLSGANIVIVNADPPGVGFNDATAVAPVGGNTGTTLGQQRLNAFRAAADKWGATLSSSVTIRIHAVWTALTCSSTSAVLGSAGTTEVWKDFTNAPVANHWYGKAQANALSGTDQDSTTADINANFNINLGNSGCLTGTRFYLGLDSNFGSNVDFVTVLTHELAHGLGFQSFTNGQTGAQLSGSPSIWDDFLLDTTTNKTWTLMTNAERAASALNTGRLAWNGGNVTAAIPQVLQPQGSSFVGADPTGRGLLYTPNPFQTGSSLSHWSTAMSPNQLMEPVLASNLTHEVAPPKDLTLPLLKDIGWSVGAGAQPPNLTIAKRHTGNFTQGQSGAVYTITVSNSGPGATSGTVTVTDTLPAGLTATAISGTGWSCQPPSGPCTRSDALSAGGSYPAIALSVNVAANAPASVTNTATVSGGGAVNSSAGDVTAVSITQPPPPPPLGAPPTIGGCPSFPANSAWNARIDKLPVDARSTDYVNSISPSAGLRFELTMPVNIVPGTQPKVPIVFISNPSESDPGPYPIPPNAQVEPGSDGHVVVVDQDNCMLYETFASALNPDGSWRVDSSAKWSLLSNALRPAGWTSADAAGLPIMPVLVRYDEVAAGQISHAIRFTAPQTQRLFKWPARHFASSSTSPTLPPMGQRFRLKAGFNIASYAPRVQTILRAMKEYGLILADNGLPWDMQFAIDSRWDAAELEVLRSIAGSNLEAVDASGLMMDPDSGQAAWPSAALFGKFAVFRLGLWVLDKNGNNAFDAGDQFVSFGLPGDQPVAGDWDGTGIVRIGVFRNGLWYLDLNNNGQWDGVPGGDGIFAFGLPGDIAVAGDWNGDGRSKMGVFRCPLIGVCTWVLDYAGKFAFDAASARFVSYGLRGDMPVVNNWSITSNTDQVGVYRPLANGLGVWIVDSNGSGAWEPSDAVYQFGLAGDIPAVGNWNNGVRKRIGVFRNGLWILDTNGNNAYDLSDGSGIFGLPGDRPVVGKW